MDFLFNQVYNNLTRRKDNIMPRKKVTKKSTAKKVEPKKIMEFADGKDHLKEEAAETRSLEEALGMTESSPFAESDASVFESNLENMNLSEMQAIAVKAGVFPSGTKMMLKTKLIKSFKKWEQGHGNVVQITRPIVDPDSEQGKALLNLIKEQ